MTGNVRFDDIFVSSRVRLARNLAGLPFPYKITERWAAEKVIKGAEAAAKDLKLQYRLVKMESLNPIDRQALAERHFISFNLAEREKVGALLLSEDETVSIMLNEEDHIRAQCIIKGFSLEECYRVIDRYDDALIKRLPIAYDSEFGFLTSCLTNLGTGMRASVMMFLPALTINGEIVRFVEKIKSDSRGQVTVRGVYGEGSETLGAMYQFSNAVSLGVAEQDIVKLVERVAAICYDAESRARITLLQRDGARLEDEVYRAYGTLAYAKRLTSNEFFSLVSVLKLGIALELIDLKGTDELNNLIALVQPANLCRHEGRELSADERDKCRARLVNENIKLLK